MQHFTVQPALVNVAAGDMRVFDLWACTYVVWREKDRPRNPVTAYKSRNKGVGVQFTTWPFWWTYHLDTCYRLDDNLVSVVELLSPESEVDIMARHPLDWELWRKGRR